MFRFSKILVIFLSVFIIASCTRYNVKVDSIKGRDFPQKGYTLLPLKDELKGLEFNEYARLIHAGLEERGFINVNDIRKSDIAIFVDFGISDPSSYTTTTSIPQWGQTGVSSSYTSGTFNSYGGYGNFSGTTSYLPSYGVTGYMPITTRHTEYTRFLKLSAVNTSSWKKDGSSVEELWKTNVVSTGSSGSLREVMPYMVAAAYPHFGTSTDKQISITLQEDDKKVKALKEGNAPAVEVKKPNAVESLLSIF